MKIYCMLMMMVVAGCAQQNVAKDSVVVVSEKPFVASPTNRAIYEDCKRAIELYEKKDPKYAMTACVGEIDIAIKLSQVVDIEYRPNGEHHHKQANQEVCALFAEGSQNNNTHLNLMGLFTQDGRVFYASKLIDFFKLRIKNDSTYANKSSQHLLVDLVQEVIVCKNKEK